MCTIVVQGRASKPLMEMKKEKKQKDMSGERKEKKGERGWGDGVSVDI